MSKDALILQQLQNTPCMSEHSNDALLKNVGGNYLAFEFQRHVVDLINFQ